MSAILRRTYVIQSWPRWDDDVNAFALDFKGAFGVFPNILLASSSTLARIDMAARREKLIDPAGQPPQPDAYASIGTFSGDGYQLEFCIDERLQSKVASLIYDTDPGGGGEPVPDEDTAQGKSQTLKRA